MDDGKQVGFKSYYVVWKRRRFASNAKRDGMFKSYYVVWKLRDFRTLQYAHRGLNRTMQYGNEQTDRQVRDRVYV